MIVIDANVIVAAVVQGPLQALAIHARQKDQWSAPGLWRSEFRSALVKMIRANILNLAEAQQHVKNADYLMFGRDFRVNGEKVLEFASKSYGSAYDCEYVVMADDFGVPLVTTDQALIEHFPKIAIHLRDYVRS
jgi:predicted nucleic acid-binding protein